MTVKELGLLLIKLDKYDNLPVVVLDGADPSDYEEVTDYEILETDYYSEKDWFKNKIVLRLKG